MAELTLCDFLEFLEPARQPISIRLIRASPRQLDLLPSDPFEAEFKERPVMNFEEPVRDVDVEIRVDPDQLGIEDGPVELRQRQALRRSAALTARPHP
jgi:hypothetical protein